MPIPQPTRRPGSIRRLPALLRTLGRPLGRFTGRAVGLLLAGLVSAAATGCIQPRLVVDPTVMVDTRGGRELGVATDFGIVFLGSTAQAGPAEVAIWYGDGPSIEPSLVEPLGGGLFLLETEIRAPTVALATVDPPHGTRVRVVGRSRDGRWHAHSRIVRHPRVEGLLIEVPAELAGPNDQVGAGVFVKDERGHDVLLGLVAGRVAIQSAAGSGEYLALVGPDQLWRVAAHRRDDALRRRWVYRDDIL